MMSPEFGMKVIPASDSALLLVLGHAISPELHARVIGLFQALRPSSTLA